MEELRNYRGGKKMTNPLFIRFTTRADKISGHDVNKWQNNLWHYYPVDYAPESYFELTQWWLEKVPTLGNSIMEIGCWSGLALAWLKKYFPDKDIIGIDANPTVVHCAKTRMFYLNLDVPIYLGDGFNLSVFADKSKDVITSDGLVEHFDEEERTKLIKEMLRVGKKVLLTVPNEVALSHKGGYGDERSLSNEEFSEYMNKHFLVEEEFLRENEYGCILGGVK